MLSLFNVMEELSVGISAPPGVDEGELLTIPVDCEVVTLWRREDAAQGATGTARLVLHPPAGNPIELGNPHVVDLTAHQRTRFRARFNGLPLRESGLYFFAVEQEEADETWREVARLPLTVTISTVDRAENGP